ncbi:4'-phosphopantetheinyl transferase [Shewanella sp. LC6]|nr:4'-phosphopantetheinyl transferase [Shewanella sp. LC6]TPE58135.1 4'-phosphopantetheinyl transferase [Shewanella sp. LC2]
MSDVNLPDSWALTTLENVATWGSGGTPSRSKPSYYEGDIPWVKTGDLGPRVLYKASEFISESAVQNSSAKFFPTGSVAIAMYGATIGRTSILGIDATTNQACGVGTPIEGITFSEFLYYFLNNEKDNFIAKGKGGAQPNISQALIKEHPITLPPLAEQKVIADKLDTLLAQVETTKARLERIPEILKSFRQSVLSAAVSGKLTEEWRESKDTCWSVVTLAKVCSSVSDGDHQAPPRAEYGIPFLVISNISNGKINFDSVSRYVPEEYYETLKDIRRPEVNDILYTVTGSFGIPVIVNSPAKFCFQRHIAIIKPDHNKVNYRYLSFYLASPDVFKYANSVATGTAQKTVSLSHLRKFSVNLPTFEEQTEIVRRVDELFTFADSIEQKANAALARVNNLTQSILAKAFRGELTADWRAANPELISGDNSAAALLEKIKAERAALVGKKTGKKA